MKRIALLGMPNAGKSTFFNRLTGASARVGNWPGITVDLLSAKIILGSHMVEVVDLPGIYDLTGFSEDEQVVRTFLSSTPLDLLLLVVNTVQIERQLRLALQVQSLGIPIILLLNMADEAKKLGITVEQDRLSEHLGAPAILLSAKYGQGYPETYRTLQNFFAGTSHTSAPSAKALPSSDLHIENTLLQERLHSIIEAFVQIPLQASDQFTRNLDQLLLNPVLGLPLFFGVMFLLFQAIFILGKPIQDGMASIMEFIRGHALEPLLAGTPTIFQQFLLDGVYNGISTVASFVPLIILFFLFMALVEDSGYLSRAAFLMDALMSRLGMDGRSFVMVLMGFGCNVPALMGTRVMRSRSLRLLTMLVIPFSLCSARLQVFIFFIAALFPTQQAGIALFSLYMMSFFSVLLTALLFKKKYINNEPFILEMPPYRFPTWRQLILRGWQEVHHFLKRATQFIILGVVLVWILTHFPLHVPPASPQTWAGQLGHFLQPVLKPIGIDEYLSIALIFGFVAKEIVIGSLAVIYGAEGQVLAHTLAQHMTAIQAYSFMLFTLIYTPCLSTVATLYTESKSRWFTLFSLIWSLCLAWIVSFIFYQTALRLV